MRKITVFNFLTVNGFYKGDHEDISWHRHGGEEADFAGDAANPAQPNALMFGRVTYQMMAGFWPTEAGQKMNPRVSDGMNRSEKFVFSRTLKSLDWQGAALVKGDIVKETIRLKDTAGADITILGSGSIVSQLATHGLIDSFTLMIDPVALGRGTP
ncbi:MAG TPA: dihydrofolate reductase family protein, partial [Chryseolinea sp.]|nr:dihydrofolate reductase family protein [Chryseolinea sp.]